MLESLQAVNSAMSWLLLSTLDEEQLVAKRDKQIAVIQKNYSPLIDKSQSQIAYFTAQIQEYCLAHPEEMEEGKKSVQLANGLMGTRAPSHPALVPLNEKWNWESIGKKLRRLWKKEYFHAPKAPAIDKVKIKRDLDENQLAACGMKLDTTESFYLELNRLASDSMISEERAA